MYDFEWDPDKETSNIRKHGVDFLTAAAIFRNSILERVDDREDYGEVRAIAIGQYQADIYRVVYTWRGESTIRIISALKADRHEREEYYRAVYNG